METVALCPIDTVQNPISDRPRPPTRYQAERSTSCTGAETFQEKRAQRSQMKKRERSRNQITSEYILRNQITGEYIPRNQITCRNTFLGRNTFLKFKCSEPSRKVPFDGPKGPVAQLCRCLAIALVEICCWKNASFARRSSACN